MIYAGDQWIQYPVKDLYDKAIMLMSLAAAKDMYEKGLKLLEDFNNKYGDFMSPIAKDMDWYNQNVTGKVRDTINNLYANGIDPLRSAEGRAAVAQLIYSMPTGEIAKLRLSAETAKEYIKNRGKLEAAGLYNQDLEERFLGFNLNNWGTIDNGVWNRISPLEAKSLKELTESSYNNRTPHDLTKEEVLSFAGQIYDPRMKYKGFTDADLLGIANTVAPGLTGTPWNDYYRDLAARKVAASGMELSDKNINAQLARDIANTQQEYLIKPIGDLDDWFKQQNLNISRMRINISRQAAKARQAGKSSSSSGSGSGTTNQKGQFDYQDFLIGTTAANVLGKTSVGPRIGVGGVSDYTPEKVSGFMGAAQKELAEGTYKYNFQTPTKSPLNLGKSFNMTDYLWDKQRSNVLLKSGGLIDIGSRYGKTFNIGAIDMSATDLDVANKSFLSQISVPSSPENFVQWTQRKSDTDNSDYVLMNLGADKGRIYSADEVALTSAGVNRPKDVPAAIKKTKELRKNLEQRFIDGKTMMKSEGFVLGRVGNDGAHHVFQKIRIVNKNKYKNANNSDLQEFKYNNIYNEGEVIYYDMGADTQGNPNYSNDFMENMNPVVTDQSLGSDRNVLKSLGLSSTNVKSDNSVPYLDYSSYDYDDDLLDLMGY